MKNNLILSILSIVTTGQILAQGFGNSPTNWALPASGGAVAGGINYSFENLYNNGTGPDNGSQAWTTTDIDGDGKPDIVSYMEKIGGGYKVPGSPSVPYWKAYINTGSGFANTPTNWALPMVGGAIFSGTNASFYELYNNGTGTDNGSQAWTTTDMDGDSKPDLVAYIERTGGNWAVPGPQGARFWKVYTNLSTVGLKNNSMNDLSADIYPNPSSGKFFVILSKDEETKVDVFNSTGVMISSQKMKGERLEINLSHQPAGIYFAKMGSVTKKIIKE